MNSTKLTQDFEDLHVEFEYLFNSENIIPEIFTVIKSSKGKDAILYKRFYYNKQSETQKSIV